MIQNEYINHNLGLKKMNNSILADLASLSSIAAGLIGMAWWGSGISARLNVIEKWKDNIEERQNRIEEKIDNLSSQTTARIDDCKQTLYDAIMTLKQ